MDKTGQTSEKLNCEPNIWIFKFLNIWHSRQHIIFKWAITCLFSSFFEEVNYSIMPDFCNMLEAL